MDVIAYPLYLAPVAQYVRLYSAGRMLLDVDSPYVKQTYRNRAVIAAENGALALTVPVVHNGVQPMRDVRISDHGNWRRMHWNAIASAYKKSPFFDYYADDFRPFYENKIEFLVDFNMQLHATVCELLGLDVPVVELSGDNGAMAEDIRSLAQPVDDCASCCLPYYQVFERRNGFLPNMSIADLLFNMGPEGLIVLRDSVAGNAVR
ncbi:MAG: WbqC family protein [Bacteroidaceae bacterium]|nr:WbqC family protein [Bacteroidaceae bacterium]